MQIVPNLFPILPELVLLISSLVILMAGVFFEKNNLKISIRFSILTLVLVSFFIFYTNQHSTETFNGLFSSNIQYHIFKFSAQN